MRDSTIARNYAEALLALAQKAEDLTGWGNMISDVADALERDALLRKFLETPRISEQVKSEVLQKALQDRMPRLMVRFLQALLRHRRQMLIPDIAVEYHHLVDEIEGRLHARVTLARTPSDEDTAVVTAQLSRVLGKKVVPHVTVNPEILGGLVVRVGDAVMDGSVRRRLATLRTRLIAGTRR